MPQVQYRNDDVQNKAKSVLHKSTKTNYSVFNCQNQVNMTMAVDQKA